MTWIFIEGDGDEIKSKQASKRDGNLWNWILIFFHGRKPTHVFKTKIVANVSEISSVEIHYKTIDIAYSFVFQLK